MTQRPLALVVLISGNGSNLQAIIDAIEKDELHATIKLVISNQPDAFGLIRAKKHGIATALCDHRDYPNRHCYDDALLALIEDVDPNLVVLAGFMRILGSRITSTYQGKMLNIHPSLLPKYPGLHTHQQALQNGDTQHGSTVHFVTKELDGGPIICQSKIDIAPTDDMKSLEGKIKSIEHQLYPQVLQWIASGQLILQDKQIIFNGERLSPTGYQLT